MLTARLFAPVTKRLVALLTLTALIVAVAPFGANRTVKACPGPPPQPLRTLYTQSELIVVARAGESSVAQVEVNDDYKYFLVCTPLHVSSTLKGEAVEPTLQVYHWVWGENSDIADAFKEGEDLLVFLNRREEGHGYQVSDTTYGVKKLSDDALKIYTKRIEELAEIMQQEKPDNAQIAEWLVRCVEESATQWDGIFELSSSYAAMTAEDAKKSSAAEKTGDTPADAASVDGDASGETVEEVTYFREGGYRPDPEFARQLTGEQKTRLGTTLFSAQTVGYNEYMLLIMVKNWNDARLVPFLLSQLRKGSEESEYYAQEMVNIVALALGNEAVTALAKQYCGSDEEEAQTSAGNESASDEEDPAVEQARIEADARKREETLQNFIALAEGSPIN